MATQTLPPSDTISTIEASKMLGVSVRTVQLWVEDGRLTAWKTPGGHRRLSRASVESMLSEKNLAVRQAVPTYEVLVVEDDGIQLELLRRSIEKITPNTRNRFCQDGYEALIRIGESRPNLLITDLMMPGLDGFRLLRTLEREQSAHPMQIIVITSLSRQEIEAQGGLGNGVALMHKPVDVSSLQALMKAYHQVWQLAGAR